MAWRRNCLQIIKAGGTRALRWTMELTQLSQHFTRSAGAGTGTNASCWQKPATNGCSRQKRAHRPDARYIRQGQFTQPGSGSGRVFYLSQVYAAPGELSDRQCVHATGVPRPLLVLVLTIPLFLMAAFRRSGRWPGAAGRSGALVRAVSPPLSTTGQRPSGCRLPSCLGSLVTPDPARQR